VTATFYLAIEPPRDVAIKIARVMSQLGDRSPAPHVTLRAPAELTADVEWLGRVRDAAARSAAFWVTTGPLGTFDDRVLYLVVESDGLLALRNEVLRAFESLDERSDETSTDQPYVPHLTLCVARGRRRLPEYEDLAAPLLTLAPFNVLGLSVLRRDDLSSPYRVWKRLPLGLHDVTGDAR
jgi:2'-5' RNA ligase